ncbi:MAG: GNAT family N-acetyltransferase [Paenibacillus sp.]|nr:GNAT family N-acetyltransferase [Paenibacillus sp.]
MDIRSLKNIDFDTVFHAFEQAFSDYEIRFEKEEVRAMLKRRGFTPELSFAMFDNGDIVAFTLNGTGIYSGVRTAYDTGTGTLKAYRGKGIAKEIFQHSIPYLKEAGIGQYLLEVIKGNEKAISVYSKLGFEVTREFDCFRQSRNELTDMAMSPADPEISIMEIPTERISTALSFCDFAPSWQNSVESLVRAGSDLKCLGAFISGNLVGYCVADPLSGDLSQIAVDRDYRRRGIASSLFGEAVKLMKSEHIKVLNVDSEDSAMAKFLSGKGVRLSGKQLEMILPL